MGYYIIFLYLFSYALLGSFFVGGGGEGVGGAGWFLCLFCLVVRVFVDVIGVFGFFFHLFVFSLVFSALLVFTCVFRLFSFIYSFVVFMYLDLRYRILLCSFSLCMYVSFVSGIAVL